MRILRASDYKRMPWKNGGGETVEIAVSPGGAGLADFDWRVSMATVATDGPFSVFSGIDRTLSILEGAGMTLFIEGREPVLLTEGSDPLPFAADAPTSATLVDGTIMDLNVMTRRGRLSHSVKRSAVDGHTELQLHAGIALLLCDHGNLRVDDADESFSLFARDCAVINETSGRRIALSGTAGIFLIEIKAI
ncbi:HutD/Ves family protein [Rhizobium rhizogenes]|uniref:HutD/Ves family protein n=1 Tax=Rhizobium rhizogenes TaxID=359 RepID=UPI0015720BA4|nr:HutD family protein [Rhizobium rhizogenes]NTH20234.1 HutD family protein [Rhizobium rhizogenes]NTH33243.1 HutD family protein [Rhizobium rhizogenes]